MIGVCTWCFEKYCNVIFGFLDVQMFISTHYAGKDLALKFRNGEPWKKVFGPVFVYLNSDMAAKKKPSVLWNDAKTRVSTYDYGLLIFIISLHPRKLKIRPARLSTFQAGLALSFDRAQNITAHLKNVVRSFSNRYLLGTH